MLIKIKKVYISVSWYFIAVIVWVSLTGRIYEFLFCINALILHELGHMGAIYFLKEKISIFYVIPFGFSCRLRNQSKITSNKMLKIICAGPVTSLIAAGLAFLWTENFAVINLIIGVFNLLPLGNLDGGRIFRILMQK